MRTDGIGLQTARQTLFLQREIGAGEVAQRRPHPIGAERMEIGAVLLAPSVELDAELDGGPGLAHELGLVEVDQCVEVPDGRNRRLTDPDDADVGALDQPDLGVRPDGSLDRGGGHPAGRAASDDQDGFDRFSHARSPSLFPRNDAALSGGMPVRSWAEAASARGANGSPPNAGSSSERPRRER